MTNDTNDTTPTASNETATTPAIRAALRAHAHELDTSDPETDLAPNVLPEGIHDAAVVALGEGTHGTREFFRLKHRLLRHLVTETGVRTFAMEANAPEARALDEYVVHGRGDPEAGLEGLYFWTWQTEEVRDLVEWLRAFNRGRPLDDRVRFFGFDAQYTHGGVERLREFLRDVDPGFLADERPALNALDDHGEPPHQDERLDVILGATGVVDRLRDRFEDRETAYIEAVNEHEYAFARRCVEVLGQAVAYKRAMRDWDEDDPESVERALGVRDRAMAANVEWVRERRAGPVVLWGHDAHLNRDRHPYRGTGVSAPSMGAHLADAYGDDYAAVGFAFGRGSFQAVGKRDGEFALREWTVDGPRSRTIEAALGALGHDICLLDARRARDDHRLAEWVGTPRQRFGIGATLDPETLAQYLVEYPAGRAFDGVLYVDATTRARPLGE